MLAALRGDIAYQWLPVIVLSALSDSPRSRHAIRSWASCRLPGCSRPPLPHGGAATEPALRSLPQAPGTTPRLAPHLLAPGPVARRCRRPSSSSSTATPSSPPSFTGLHSRPTTRSSRWTTGARRRARWPAGRRSSPATRARAAAAVGARGWRPEAAQAAGRDVALSLHRGAQPHRRGGPGSSTRSCRGPASPRDLPQQEFARWLCRRQARGGESTRPGRARSNQPLDLAGGPSPACRHLSAAQTRRRASSGLRGRAPPWREERGPKSREEGDDR